LNPIFPAAGNNASELCCIVLLPADPAGLPAFTVKSRDSVRFGHILDSLIT
jgi:hypothetical protein